MSLFSPNGVCTSYLVTSAQLLTARDISPLSNLTVSYVPLRTLIFGHSIAPFPPSSLATIPNTLLWASRVSLIMQCTCDPPFQDFPVHAHLPHVQYIWVLPVLRYPRNMVIYHYPLIGVIYMVILHIFIIKNYPNFFSNYYPKYTIRVIHPFIFNLGDF